MYTQGETYWQKQSYQSKTGARDFKESKNFSRKSLFQRRIQNDIQSVIKQIEPSFTPC